MEIVYIAHTVLTGKGVFAARDIQKDELIFDFEGPLVKSEYDQDYDIGDRWVGIGKGEWINTNPLNPGYYINHSCEPNAGITNIKTVRAMKDISKDEEVVFDYSTSEEDPFWQMECRCGVDECRVIIKNIQSLDIAIYQLYLPYVSNYFQQVYKDVHPELAAIG